MFQALEIHINGTGFPKDAITVGFSTTKEEMSLYIVVF